MIARGRSGCPDPTRIGPTRAIFRKPDPTRGPIFQFQKSPTRPDFESKARGYPKEFFCVKTPTLKWLQGKTFVQQYFFIKRSSFCNISLIASFFFAGKRTFVFLRLRLDEYSTSTRKWLASLGISWTLMCRLYVATVEVERIWHDYDKGRLRSDVDVPSLCCYS